MFSYLICTKVTNIGVTNAKIVCRVTAESGVGSELLRWRFIGRGDVSVTPLVAWYKTAL